MEKPMPSHAACGRCGHDPADHDALGCRTCTCSLTSFALERGFAEA
jgi:hypothetical protein